MKGALGHNRQLTRFRLYLRMHPQLSELDEDERVLLAFEYWHAEMSDRIQNDEFESAWHCLIASAIGDEVFHGPRGVCRPNLEGLPVGRLVCSTADVIELVEFLYDAIPENTTLDWANHFRKPPSWEVTTESGSVELLECGNPVSMMLAKKDNTRCYIAALQAMAICVYVNNRRRLGKAAA